MVLSCRIICLLLLLHGVCGASLLGVASTAPIMSGKTHEQILNIENKVSDLQNQLGQMNQMIKNIPSSGEKKLAFASDLEELDKKVVKQLHNIQELIKANPSSNANDAHNFLTSSELDIFEKRMVNMITANEHKFDKFNNTLYNDIDNFNNNINIQLGYILNDILALRRSFDTELLSNITLLQENINSSVSGHDIIISDLIRQINAMNESYEVLNDTYSTKISDLIISFVGSINQINSTIDSVNNTVLTVHNNLNDSIHHEFNHRFTLMNQETIQNITEIIMNITSLAQEVSLSHDSIMTNLTTNMQIFNHTYDAMYSTMNTSLELLNHEVNSNFSVLHDEVHANISILTHEILYNITNLEHIFRVNVTSLSQETYDNMTMLGQQTYGNITALSQQTNGNITALSQQTYDNITLLNQETYGNITALSQQAYSNITVLSRETYGNITVLSQDAYDNITALYSVFRSSQINLSDKFASEIADLNNSVSNTIEKYSTQQEQRIIEASHDLAVLNASLLAVNTSLLSALDSSNAILLSNIASISEKLSEVTGNIDAVNATLHHQLYNSTSHFMDAIRATQADNNMAMATFNESLLQRLVLVNNTIHEYVDVNFIDLRNQVSESSENIKLLEKSYYKLNENYNNLNNNFNELGNKLTDLSSELLSSTHKTMQEYVDATNIKINNIQQEIQSTTTTITRLHTQYAVDAALNEKYRDDYEKKIKSFEDHIKILEEKLGVANININSNDVLIQSMEKRLLAIEAELRKS